MLKKYPGILLGIFITLLSLFFFSLVAIIPSLMKEPYESSNYKEIQNNGENIRGVVINKKENLNITINGEHPTVISYKFKLNDNERFAKYRTLENDKILNLKVNDTINLKYLKGETKIDALEPFSFSIMPFLFIPLPFIIIGIVIIILSLKPYLLERKIIKYGEARKGTIVSIFPFSGFPITNFGKHVLVNYYYFSQTGEKLYGKAKIINLNVLNGKKIDNNIEIVVLKEDELKSTIYDIS